MSKLPDLPDSWLGKMTGSHSPSPVLSFSSSLLLLLYLFFLSMSPWSRSDGPQWTLILFLVSSAFSPANPQIYSRLPPTLLFFLLSFAFSSAIPQIYSLRLPHLRFSVCFVPHIFFLLFLSNSLTLSFTSN